MLPTWLSSLELEGLRVGGSSVDLQLERYHNDVGVRVLGRREESVEIVVVK
ncbi:MAG: hypothetical protein H5U40_15065 [Polyangiaceae bacterium]|nr:hypothetical protein [Polyangiaceae bacterium]